MSTDRSTQMANTRIFYCVKGRLTTEDQLALLVWIFEVPPSSIVIEGSKVTVPANQESRNIYDNYCTTRNAYKFSAPKVIGTKYGIMLRRFNETCRKAHFQQKMTKDESTMLTDYNVEMPFSGTVLDKVSDRHPIAGDWNPKTRKLEIEEGLGYRNTGNHFKTNSNGENTRRQDSPIRFVKPAVIEMEEGELDE